MLNAMQNRETLASGPPLRERKEMGKRKSANTCQERDVIMPGSLGMRKVRESEKMNVAWNVAQSHAYLLPPSLFFFFHMDSSFPTTRLKRGERRDNGTGIHVNPPKGRSAFFPSCQTKKKWGVSATGKKPQLSQLEKKNGDLRRREFTVHKLLEKKVL